MISSNVLSDRSRLGEPSLSPTRQAQRESGLTPPADSKEFHLQEYNAMREEIMQHVAVNTSIEREALIGSVAVYSWALSQSFPLMYLPLIFFLPTALTYMSWMRARTHGDRIWTLGRYIGFLERHFREPIQVQVQRQEPGPPWRQWFNWPGSQRSRTKTTKSSVYGWEHFLEQSRLAPSDPLGVTADITKDPLEITTNINDRLGTTTDMRWKIYLIFNAFLFLVLCLDLIMRRYFHLIS